MECDGDGAQKNGETKLKFTALRLGPIESVVQIGGNTGKLHIGFHFGPTVGKLETADRYLPNPRTFAALFEGKMRYGAGIRDEVKS
jgi:hypothetical protein